MIRIVTLERLEPHMLAPFSGTSVTEIVFTPISGGGRAMSAGCKGKEH